MAHDAHWGDGTTPMKYGYLNVTTRNWIQWLSDSEALDGRVVENARVYLDHSQLVASQFYDENAPPHPDLYYTIHSRNLDPAKLGFRLYGELQFEFYTVGCGDELSMTVRGPIRIRFPDQSEHCLRRGTMNPLLVR